MIVHNILVLNICEDLRILKIMLLISKILKIALITVPILLIIMITFDFIKCIMSNDSQMLRKATSKAVERIVCGIIIFFVPTIINFITGLLDLSGIEIDLSCLNVTQEILDAKKELAVRECNGDNLRWNELTLTCDVIEKQEIIVQQEPVNVPTYTPPTSTSTTTTKLQNLIYYNQGTAPWKSVPFCSSGKNLHGSGCGAVSFAMIADSFSSESYTPKVVANWLCSNGHGGGALSSNWFTNSKLLNRFDLSVTTLFVNGNNKGNSGTTYNSSQGEKLLSAVQNGKGIILYIPGHYVAVGPNPSCKATQVYLYDGGRRANNGCYTPKELFNKTYNYNSKCTKNRNCGWKGAWAFSGK